MSFMSWAAEVRDTSTHVFTSEKVAQAFPRVWQRAIYSPVPAYLSISGHYTRVPPPPPESWRHSTMRSTMMTHGMGRGQFEANIDPGRIYTPEVCFNTSFTDTRPGVIKRALFCSHPLCPCVNCVGGKYLQPYKPRNRYFQHLFFALYRHAVHTIGCMVARETLHPWVCSTTRWSKPANITHPLWMCNVLRLVFSDARTTLRRSLRLRSQQ